MNGDWVGGRSVAPMSGCHGMIVDRYATLTCGRDRRWRPESPRAGRYRHVVVGPGMLTWEHESRPCGREQPVTGCGPRSGESLTAWQPKGSRFESRHDVQGGQCSSYRRQGYSSRMLSS